MPSCAGTFLYAPPAMNEPSSARSRANDPLTPVRISSYCFSRPDTPTLSTLTMPSTCEASAPLGYTRLMAGSNSMPVMFFFSRISASASSTWRLTYANVVSWSIRSETKSSSTPNTSTRALIAFLRCFFSMSCGLT